MKKPLYYFTGIYLVLFTLYSLATRFTLTACFMDGAINTWLYRGILAVGCILAFTRIPALQENIRKKDTLLLALFVLILFIGIFLNRNYGLTDNLYGFLTFGFELVLFYWLAHSLTEKDWLYYLKRIILLGSFLWDIACVGSIALYLFNIRYVCQYASDHGTVRQGIVDGRLFGLFTDPNFAAFTSLLLIYGLWYVIRHSHLKLVRIFCYGSMAVQMIYIIMSNSRTVYLSVIGSVLFFVLFLFHQRGEKAKQLVLRGILTLLCLVVLHVAVMFVMQTSAKLITPDRDTETELLRNDIDTDNISNNRFTIWTAYLKLYRKQPIFGFSFRSAIPFAEKNEPDGYLAQTQYVTHNSYLSLLVETGILGFLVMAVFLLSLLVRVVKRVREKKPVSDTFLLFSTWILSTLIFCLCFHDIFFTLNIETMLFWCGLGYLNKECP